MLADSAQHRFTVGHPCFTTFCSLFTVLHLFSSFYGPCVGVRNGKNSPERGEPGRIKGINVKEVLFPGAIP